jgi:membrane protein
MINSLCDKPIQAYPAWQHPLLWAGRLVLALLRDMFSEQLSLRAMSLVYTTLLSLVPLLALSFSVLKGFGVHNQLEPLMLSVLAPLGEKAGQITEQILGFVSNMKVGVLGAVGLGLLFYTVFTLMHKIVRAIDFTWNNHADRGFARRFTDYLAMLLVGPVLMFSVAGAMVGFVETQTIQSLLEIEFIGQIYELARQWLPFGLIVMGLSFIYWFFPGVRVRWYAALAGGVTAGLLWKTIGWVFAVFVVNSSKYTAVYSAFATVLLFMIWLYLSWLILLLGSRIAFYVQFPRNTCPEPEGGGPQSQEYLGLKLIHHIITAFQGEQGRPSKMSELVAFMQRPAERLQPLLAILVQAGYLIQVEERDPLYSPARDPDKVMLAEVVRVFREGPEGPIKTVSGDDLVMETLSTVNQAIEQALGEVSLKHWVQSASYPSTISIGDITPNDS